MDELRHKIHEINTSNLSSEEKSKKIFLLMNPNIKQKDTQEKEIKNTEMFNYDNNGCQHYRRKCLLKASCCGVFVPCRLCHDEKMDHKIDRFKTQIMKCKICNLEQEVSQKCKQCDTIMGKYYCDVCKFWNDDYDDNIFHCEQCGMCRKGKKENYFHCNKCNICLSIHLKDTHVCINNSLQNDCSICGDDLFTSTTSVSILKCGHSIHTECLNEYIKNNNYQCMLCKKSVMDMTEYWKQIDDFVKTQNMPDEYKNTKANIFCNDCEKECKTQYHFIYNKCDFCNGYNTFIKNII